MDQLITGIARSFGNFSYFCYPLWSYFLVAVGATLGLGSTGLAQIVPDNTLGLEQTILVPNASVNGLPAALIEGGALRGTNLFQSFTEFNVLNGQQVYFGNPAGVQTILSRVTGTNSSNIWGTLGVLGNANLFLINPNGLFFGPNARLDIRGSFVASTAERLTFPDGSEFGTKNPQPAPLLTLNLPIGLQYGGQPGAIANTANLVVGQNLTLAGGTVTSSGQLSAPSGQVIVTGVTGDVQVQNLTAQSATLSSAGNLILHGSQLQTTGDLTLLATGTLQVRDSALHPFVASAGGQLLVQGNQSVDIFALNHRSSGFFSGGDLVLRSSSAIVGDAHYATGGNFQIQQLNGQLGNLYSPNDPVIRASGDVAFNSYSGASLHIIAGGSVQITGSITIDSVDAVNGLIDTVTLANGSVLNINGQTVPTLDIRAGTTNFAPPGVTPGAGGFTPGVPGTGGTATGANITVGDINFLSPGLVFLTNQYFPSNSSGDITVNSISNAGFFSDGGTVIIESRGGLTVNGSIDTSDASFLSGNGGPVSLNARGNLVLNNLGLPSITSTGLLGGPITLQSASDIIINGSITSQSTTDQPGKGNSITIQGRSVVVTQPVGVTTNSILFAGADAGDISIQASDRIFFGNGASVFSANESGLAGNATGRSGNIFLQAPQIFLAGGTQLAVGTVNGGQAGSITLQGTDITLDGPGTTLISQVFPGATGNGGTIAINAGTLTLSNGASLFTATQGQSLGGQGARGGNINVQATNQVVLNSGTLNSSVLIGATGGALGGDITIAALILSISNNALNTNGSLSSFVDVGVAGQGGNISLQLNTLSLANRASITSETLGLGNAGNIQIEAGNGSVDINGGTISARTASQGAGGAIAITTGRFNLTGGGQLLSTASNSGNAGSIQVNANQQFQLANPNTGLFVSTAPGSTGNGGAITVNTANFQIFDNALLTASTAGSGSGGTLTVNAGSFTLGSGGQLRTSTSSSGNAGSMEVNVLNRLQIDGSGTGLFADTTPGATGLGGSIRIDPPVVLLSNGATVSVNSLGSGNAGSIFLQAGSLTLSRGASLTAFSASGQGGNIDLQIQNILLMRFGSLISAEARNNGNGGNININAGFVVAVPDEVSNIIANAFQGRGGNIQISTQNIFGFTLIPQQPPKSLISASSQFGLQGVITITTPGIDPNKGLVALPSGIVDASKLVAQGCSADVAEQTGVGRFVVTGRGGLPPAPGDFLSNDVIWEDVEPGTGGARSGTTSSGPAQGWTISDQGEVTLVSRPINRCYAR